MSIPANRVAAIFNIHAISKISPSIVLVLKLEREMFYFRLIKIYKSKLSIL